MLLIRAAPAGSEDLRIGIIDFYGLHHVSESAAREALRIKEGDTVVLTDDGPPAFVMRSERRLTRLTGVRRARLNFVCCDAGRAILYVGIEERGSPTLRFRAVPRGRVRLADDVLQAGHDFSEALIQAIQRGDAGEDRSKGYSLANDAATRAVQERFLGFAARDEEQLRDVLYHSSDAEHRALAAQILGYAADTRNVIGDLAYGTNDPAESVRNNAMRALAIIAAFATRSPELKLVVPTQPFVSLLNSLVWTDRNKASMALMELSAANPKVIENLREQTLGPLIEMAHWKSEGHAAPAVWILGRIGGLSDDAIQVAWSRGDREAVIDAALKRR